MNSESPAAGLGAGANGVRAGTARTERKARKGGSAGREERGVLRQWVGLCDSGVFDGCPGRGFLLTMCVPGCAARSGGGMVVVVPGFQRGHDVHVAVKMYKKNLKKKKKSQSVQKKKSPSVQKM